MMRKKNGKKKNGKKKKMRKIKLLLSKNFIFKNNDLVIQVLLINPHQLHNTHIQTQEVAGSSDILFSDQISNNVVTFEMELTNLLFPGTTEFKCIYTAL